ncbi:MAG: DUF6773 family protein [Christensenellales bacterium]
MKLYLKTKNVLDERETQEMYRIEHRGMWGMYALLCAAVVVQMLFGAGFAQVAGEAFVIAVVSVGMIIAYARRGVWDADARPSTGGNAAYALLCALGVTAVTFGLHENAAKALLFGAAAFILCFCSAVAADGLRQEAPKAAERRAGRRIRETLGRCPKPQQGTEFPAPSDLF